MRRSISPHLNREISGNSAGVHQTATIDIGEVIARIQNIEIGETDAIFVCCGLGGTWRMLPRIVSPHSGRRLSNQSSGCLPYPVFLKERNGRQKQQMILRGSPRYLMGSSSLITRPGLRRYRRLENRAHKKVHGLCRIFGIKKVPEKVSPIHPTFAALNLGIVRRISLILRAGEFKADGGIELAEVVMDSGEVLNTMKGMGFITIGYAVEHLPQHPFGFLSRWSPSQFFSGKNRRNGHHVSSNLPNRRFITKFQHPAI